MIDECTETTKEMKLANITLTENENSNYERNSCMVYIVMVIVVFIIFTRITIYFVYYNWSLIENNTHKLNKLHKLYKLYKLGTAKQANYYFQNDIIDLENSDASLLKIDKKSSKNISIYNIGYVTKKKNDDCNIINSVNPFYLNITHSNGYIKEKGMNKYLVFDSTGENNELLKKYNDVFNGVRDKIKK